MPTGDCTNKEWLCKALVLDSAYPWRLWRPSPMPNFFGRHSDTLITIATIALTFLGLVTIMDQRFNAVAQRFNAQDKLIDQRFNAQDRRIDDLKADMNRRFDRLSDEIFELRKLTVSIIERVSRNEGEIDVIREQLQIADKPAPVD